jgi:hypothetical protein
MRAMVKGEVNRALNSASSSSNSNGNKNVNIASMSSLRTDFYVALSSATHEVTASSILGGWKRVFGSVIEVGSEAELRKRMKDLFRDESSDTCHWRDFEKVALSSENALMELNATKALLTRDFEV